MPNASNCSNCNAKFNIFRWRHSCDECGRTYCSKCTSKLDKYPYYLLEKPTAKYKNDYVCTECWQSKISFFHAKYNEAITRVELIECFPETYKGNVGVDNSAQSLVPESTYHRNRDNSIAQLKITALVNKFDVIYNLKLHRATDSETSDSGKGTHYYSVWKAKGIAGKRKQNEERRA